MLQTRLQAAMEYLMTYGWAILIIAIVLLALFTLGIFTPGTYLNPTCYLPAGFNCQSVFLASNGIATINLQQTTPEPINITAMGCNANNTVANMIPVNQMPIVPTVNAIRLQIGANYTFKVQCYAGNSKYSAPISTILKGWLYLNYTELTSGFPHTIGGQLIAKVT